MRYIFSTVGTSLLTTTVKEKGLKIDLYQYANLKEEDFNDLNTGS